jgi:ribonuclease P protein component
LAQVNSYGNLYDISSTHNQEEEDSRIPGKDEHRGRSGCYQEEKKKGTEEAGRLTGARIYHPLRRRGDFKAVFDHGSKFSSKNLVIYSRPSGLSFSRIGLAVSRKVGNAVTRNRIKRRLREAVRKHLKDLSIAYDIVIVARRTAAEAGFADLDRDLSRFFSRLVHEKSIDRGTEVL